MTENERKQAIRFQDEIGEIVDQYLKEGMRADFIQEVLQDEAGADLEARRRELRHE